MVGTQRKSRGDKNKTNIDTETISGRKFLDGKERGPSENCCRKGRETSNWKRPLGWVVGQSPLSTATLLVTGVGLHGVKHLMGALLVTLGKGENQGYSQPSEDLNLCKPLSL